MRKRVLVIEDDQHTSRLVELHLGELGCDVTTVASVAEGSYRASSEAYDLVILDLMLPDGDGLDVCRKLRGGGDYVPILILTARSDETDRVVGLELGADDYLPKPFGVRELVARVRALLRRVEMMAEREAAPRIEVGPVVIDADKRRVRVDGQEIELTAREFDLLLEFARHPGRVYTRDQLLDAVWGYGAGYYEHTVNSHINRLRSKIEPDPGDPRYIQTVWGVGYRFFEPGEPESARSEATTDDSRPSS